MSGPEVLVVTGLSGAGKSTAVHALEDLGFFCVDNLPSSVIEMTLQACLKDGVQRIALVIDARVGSSLEASLKVLDGLQETVAPDLTILFLDATDQAILRRFSGTRRPHPLSGKPGQTSGHAADAVLEGIRIERERLAGLRARATHIIDTTKLTVHELRRRVLDHFGPGEGQRLRMKTRIVSFGFKYGAPVDADLMFDMRFLPNPYFVDELRALSGLEVAVRDFIMQHEDSLEMIERTVALLAFCLPRYEAEGKSYLTIAVGCTGGRHRSVATAEILARRLREATGHQIVVMHRDIQRDTMAPPAEPDFGGGPPRDRRE